MVFVFNRSLGTEECKPGAVVAFTRYRRRQVAGSQNFKTPTRKYMLQKLNNRRGGFTLVEIMIVVAIIALLASIAVPNFLRARLRSQATACKQDLRMIDAAIEQWSIEKNQPTGATITVSDLAAYVKENSPLYVPLKAGAAKDTLGSDITISKVGTRLVVPAATVTACADVADSVFWSPYQP